ncbi:MAG: 3-hydroxyacyl-CoA dehydrogenase family protein [Bacteroidetes bacterium]|nr:3-hydroxyacyl-CoA dehydrogenase family protein [Bacteroidota bacterium]
MDNIGIIGEGKMGTNLLYYLLDMHFSLTWICSPEADLEKIRKHFRKRLERSLDAGLFDEERFQDILIRVRISSDLNDISTCDLIIETIIEELEAKKNLFRKLDSIANPGCIFTSNSSSIHPSKLIPSEERKKQFAGLHFFYPVALKDIAEIIVTEETSPETLEKIRAFLHSIRRKFLVLREKDSFILNRIFLDFQNEAFLMVQEKKATLHQVDRIVRDRFFPLGVFEFFDSVGLDVMLASVKNYAEQDADRERFLSLIRKLDELVSAGKLGMKTREGFYAEDQPRDPGNPESDDEIAGILRESYFASFRKFCSSSGIPPAEIKTAMDEYFGADTPALS